MSTVTRLNKMQRCKYLAPERWLSGELNFWRNNVPGSLKGYSTQLYEDALNEWLKTQQRNIKHDNR